MEAIRRSFLFFLCWTVLPCAGQQPYPAVRPLKQLFLVPDVHKANVKLLIQSRPGKDLYLLQCHSAGYAGDADFDYSGDFECRLSSVGDRDLYSTLLTEDVHQSRDWESRGRFFASELRGKCASIPEFGATRNFKLRGMDLRLEVADLTFTVKGDLQSLRLTVTVLPDASAQLPITRIVPLPRSGIPGGCLIRQHFIDLSGSQAGAGR